MTSKSWDPRQRVPDLSGQVALVTGGSSGIGLETVKYLAKRGAMVFFTSTSSSKGNSIRKSILGAAPEVSEDRLVCLPMDLGDLQSVDRAVIDLKKQTSKLNILINNASLATKDLEQNAAGWEKVMAVSHMGHFLLTNRLLSLLKSAAAQGENARVVTVSSSGHYLFIPSGYPIDFSTTDSIRGELPSEPWRYKYLQKHMVRVDALRYAVAKLAGVMFARELQRILDARGLPIISLSVNPGAVKTDAGLSLFVSPLQPVMRRVMVTPEEGSLNVLFAAADPEVAKNSHFKGSYLEPVGKIHPAHPLSSDTAQNSALWATTEKEMTRYLAEIGADQLLPWQ
ncbi:daunorubicin C-13 ketoreductase [Trichoderma chlorosporum]